MAKEFVRQGHEVVHISRSFADMPEEEQMEGVLHKRIRGYDWTSSGMRLWLDFLYSLRARTAVPTDSDIVVTNTFWAPLVLPFNLRQRCVVDVARIPKGQMPLYAQAALLRANSSPVAKAIQRELPFNQHHRVVTIPNPLPFGNLSDVNFRAKEPVVLYAGRITQEKGLDLLLKAFNFLGAGWKLQIVGPSDKKAGGGGASYLESLKRLAGNDNVEFVGPVYDTDLLNQFYAKASIFVYPSVSEQGESFGLAPLEAMAWGCVPVVSKIACFQDFIKDGNNGLIFDHRGNGAVDLLREAIIRLIEDSDLRLKLAQEALRVRQSHSTACVASAFLKDFKRTLGHSKHVNTAIYENLYPRKTL